MSGPLTYKYVKGQFYLDNEVVDFRVVSDAVKQGRTIHILDATAEDVTYKMLCRIAFRGCLTLSPGKDYNIYDILEDHIPIEILTDYIEKGGYLEWMRRKRRLLD